MDTIKACTRSSVIKKIPNLRNILRYSKDLPVNGGVSNPVDHLAVSTMNWKFDNSIMIQGIAEPQIYKYVNRMTNYGVKIVAGVSSGYEMTETDAIPIFDLVEEAIEEIGAIKTSIIFAPGDRVLDVATEAIASGIEQLVIVSSDVAPLDTIELLKRAKVNNTLILGPGSEGIIVPEKCFLGTLQPQYFRAGKVGIIGYSPASIYEVAWALNKAQIGQSKAIALGNNKIANINVVQWLKILDEDDSTEVIVLIQLAQDINYKALEFIANAVSKPVICYLIGLQTPTDKIFRDSLDILKNHLSNSIPVTNSYKQIVTAIKKTGAIVADKPSKISQLVEGIGRKPKRKTS